MKKNDEVIILDTFWEIDRKYIGRMGVLSVIPTETHLGSVKLEGRSGMIVYIDENGYAPVSSLIKELF
jgi:hypothetical protein